MSWSVEFSPEAEKQVKKLEATTRSMIYRWLNKNIEGCENPRAHGRALVGDLEGLWRYRVGKYRVLCEMKDAEMVVLAVEVGHRSKVYAQRRHK